MGIAQPKRGHRLAPNGDAYHARYLLMIAQTSCGTHCEREAERWSQDLSSSKGMSRKTNGPWI